MDDETGTIAPLPSNDDSNRYRQHFGCPYKMDHLLLKFTLSEARQLARAIANHARVRVLKQLHRDHRADTMRLQEELDKVRLMDSKDPLWALQRTEFYSTIPWKRIAKEQMQGRTASECKVFWNGHACPHNPNINRSRTWCKRDNESLKRIAEAHSESDWQRISQQHAVGVSPCSLSLPFIVSLYVPSSPSSMCPRCECITLCVMWSVSARRYSAHSSGCRR